jgi:hypothetical protein
VIGVALNRDLGPLRSQRGLQAEIVVDYRQRQRSQVALHGDCTSSRQAASLSCPAIRISSTMRRQSAHAQVGTPLITRYSQAMKRVRLTKVKALLLGHRTNAHSAISQDDAIGAKRSQSLVLRSET